MRKRLYSSIEDIKENTSTNRSIIATANRVVDPLGEHNDVQQKINLL
jgi:hypothetical protein